MFFCLFLERVFGMKALLENFLTSGHQFNNEEYELKSKFILLNSAISLVLLFIVVLTGILFLNDDVSFVLFNSLYILVSFVLLFYLRKSILYYKYIMYIFSLISLVLLSVAIALYPKEHARISWYFIILLFSYFLGSKYLGYIMTVLSIFSLIILNYSLDMDFSLYILILIIFILLLASILINLYENREKQAKQRLCDMNVDLELRVKNEIDKRMAVYEESNRKLKESADELNAQKNAYQELAFYDTLTGLPNRVLFHDRLKHAITKSKRSNTKLAVLFLDLDNFKEINDSLGHDVGDKVLKITATRLKNRMRQSDTLARLGGDEFTLLLEDLHDMSAIGNIAKNLIDVISEAICVVNHELYISASIGISMYPEDGTDEDALLKYADAAMYSAKEEGSSLPHFYKKEMTEKSLERLRLEASMRQALENDEFVLHYQPVISARESKLIGIEALVRWQHPQEGLLFPSHFIDAAESSSIIVPLGEQVLRKATKQLALWHKKGFDPGFMSVNLSVKQLHHQGLVPLISDILKSISFRTSWLELEITESYTMQNPKEAIKLLKQIRRLGVKFSIDDFGTGYSSLAYLKKLPVSKLKIDRSFIRDIPRNKGDKALVSAIVSMSKSMHLDVVAEGVENKEQKDFLESIGCDKIQGYYFAKPMPAKEIEKKYLN